MVRLEYFRQLMAKLKFFQTICCQDHNIFIYSESKIEIFLFSQCLRLGFFQTANQCQGLKHLQSVSKIGIFSDNLHTAKIGNCSEIFSYYDWNIFRPFVAKIGMPAYNLPYERSIRYRFVS